MKISVIGAGNIGRTLGEKWKTAGHSVIYGVRDPQSKPDLEAVYTIGDAVDVGEVVVFAIPGNAMPETVDGLGALLDHKIVIDATNNVGSDVMHQLPLLQSKAPNAHLYRAFSNLGWENFADPIIGETQLDLFFCGSDAERPIVSGLITEIGLNPVYIGDLTLADIIDATTRLWFILALQQQKGRHLGFKVLVE